MGEMSLEDFAAEYRARILAVGDEVLWLKSHLDLKEPPRGADVSNTGEAIDNIMLTYRHLEDACMRLGKVVQALDGGASGQRSFATLTTYSK